MPKVLIVEDEPAAGRYLRSILEQKRSEFQVVGNAENGQEALKQISMLKPDLVITDIKMPVMDGIELIVTLKKDFPTLPVIVVSGHQEFEYARRVLDTGVVDYLLKPVNPIELTEILDRLGSRLIRHSQMQRAKTLLNFINGKPCAADNFPLSSSFVAPDELFWLGVVRFGGLPARFRLEGNSDDRLICSEDFYILPGCDFRERIFLAHKKTIPYDTFIEKVRSEADAENTSFRTVLILCEASRADALKKIACEACISVNSLIVAGASQIHFGAVKQIQDAQWDTVLSDRIELALLESRADLLEKEIRDLVAGWKTCRLPLIVAESQLRRLLYFVLRKAPHANRSVETNLEFFLEEALVDVADFDDLSDAAWSLFAMAAGTENADFRDTDVPSFFHAIKRYVGENYAEPLTLQLLSKTFRISSSYLSKLFRQYANRSFVEFLSSIRMESAKRLILEKPALPLNEVAERVGYTDPFYFSRVFKLYFGSSPSNFARANALE